jgi:NAD(P)-dependent dehydrogenase (short-subunit alcohol dehydrogenase family)
MRPSLAGKVVLITGAARGIGAEAARLAAARGARVALVGMEPDRLAALAAGLGEGHAWAACDVTDQEALERAVARVAESLGGIDVVVANAGIASHGTVAISPIEAQVRVIAVNLVGVMRTAQVTLPLLVRSRGYFLIVSSAAAFSALPGMAPYAASKAGVEQYGNVLRLEVAHHGVSVGVIHPSWIDTDLVRDFQRELPTFGRALRRLPGPFGRVTSVEACASAIVEGIERRARRIYVPGSLRWLALVRSLFASEFAERLTLRRGGGRIARAEDEVVGNGRHFGTSSVGFGSGGTPGEPPSGNEGAAGGATDEDGTRPRRQP